MNSEELNRREAIKRGAILGGGMLALKGLSPLAWAAPRSNEMPMSLFGKTGVRVSKIGVGTASLSKPECSEEEAMRVIDQAIDEGINYFDTAPRYDQGEAERRTGKGLKGKRDKVFLVSKTHDQSYEGTWKLLEQSLKHLQTDYLDMVHLHNIGLESRWEDLDFAFSEKGAMGALREAKQKGMVRFIGATGHLYPSRFARVVESDEIDALMVAVNFVNQHTYNFEDKVWLPAASKNKGLVSMKVFGGRVGRTASHRFDPADYENALRYTLSLKGLNTAVVGMSSRAHLNQLLETFRRVDALSEEELIAVARRGRELIEENPRLQAMHGGSTA